LFLYLPVEHEAELPGLGWRRTFGLRVLWSGEAGDEEVMILPHVSTDFGFTLRLASLLTREQADPFRLLDGLEGWL